MVQVRDGDGAGENGDGVRHSSRRHRALLGNAAEGAGAPTHHAGASHIGLMAGWVDGYEIDALSRVGWGKMGHVG